MEVHRSLDAADEGISTELPLLCSVLFGDKKLVVINSLFIAILQTLQVSESTKRKKVDKFVAMGNGFFTRLC